jgi:Flp pilus assembly protein TadB
MTIETTIEKLNKLFNPKFWDCAQVTISTAKTAEGIVEDVKKASKPSLKKFNAKSFAITRETIPNYILLCTGVGMCCQGAAYALHAPWYLCIVFIGLIGFLTMRFQELGKPQDENIFENDC